MFRGARRTRKGVARELRSGATAIAEKSGEGAKLSAICILLILAVIVVFSQTLRHDFVNFDDDIYVYANEHVVRGLTGDGVVWAFTDLDTVAQWIPVTWLSLMADSQWMGSHGLPPNLARLAEEMHAVNVALQATDAILLFLVLYGMTASCWRSAFVAAVFAVHPLHVESVAWVTERKDVLAQCSAFWRLGLTRGMRGDRASLDICRSSSHLLWALWPSRYW